MKGNMNPGSTHTKQVSHNQRPENKDNLDSRSGEEQLTKGDDITHNSRETKKDHLKEHGQDQSK